MKPIRSKFIKKFKCFLISKFLKFSAANEEDCKAVYDWRNDELNRKYSLNSETIPWETHQIWFKARIISSQSKILIVSYLGRNIGVTIFNFDDDFSEISIYLVPGNHGKGYGLSILYAAESWIKLSNLKKDIRAKIIPENKASISIFKDAGYVFIKPEKNYEIWEKRLNNAS